MVFSQRHETAHTAEATVRSAAGHFSLLHSPALSGRAVGTDLQSAGEIFMLTPIAE